MADTLEHAFFYNSQNGDRKYDAESFEYWLKKFFTSGVFTGDCQVTANDSMTVAMSSGYANVDGKVRFFTEEQTFTLETAHATYDRIDTVVIQRNDTDRDVIAKVITGGYSTQPLPAAPIRESGIYELVVAQIYVEAGAVKITQADITDTRTDPDICGIVTGTVTQYDFSQFKAQFDGYFANHKQQAEKDYESHLQVLSEQEEQFNAWFANVQNTLSGDTAGNLLVMIGNLAALTTEAKDSLVDAINELADKEPDLLETIEEVEANTTAGKHVDALVVKEINNNLSKVKTYVDEDGKLHFVDSAGADTELPFSGGMNIGTLSIHAINTTNGTWACIAVNKDGVYTSVYGTNTTAAKTISEIVSVNYTALTALTEGFKYKKSPDAEWTEVAKGESISTGNGTDLIFTWE